MIIPIPPLTPKISEYYDVLSLAKIRLSRFNKTKINAKTEVHKISQVKYIFKFKRSEEEVSKVIIIPLDKYPFGVGVQGGDINTLGHVSKGGVGIQGDYTLSLDIFSNLLIGVTCVSALEVPYNSSANIGITFNKEYIQDSNLNIGLVNISSVGREISNSILIGVTNISLFSVTRTTIDTIKIGVKCISDYFVYVNNNSICNIGLKNNSLINKEVIINSHCNIGLKNNSGLFQLIIGSFGNQVYPYIVNNSKIPSYTIPDNIGIFTTTTQTPNVGTDIIPVVFTPYDTNIYGDAITLDVPITLAKGLPNIIFNLPAQSQINTTLSSYPATSSSGVSFTYRKDSLTGPTYTLNTPLNTAGSLTIYAVSIENTNYISNFKDSTTKVMGTTTFIGSGLLVDNPYGFKFDASYFGTANNPGLTTYYLALTNETIAQHDSNTNQWTYFPSPYVPIIGYTYVGVSFVPYTPYYNAVNFKYFKYVNITKVDLYIIADYKQRVYLEANPPLTVSYIGFVNNENIDSIAKTGGFILSTTAQQNSNVGEYNIHVNKNTFIAANYNVYTGDAPLFINPAVPTISITPDYITYGQTLISGTLHEVESMSGTWIFYYQYGSSYIEFAKVVVNKEANTRTWYYKRTIVSNWTTDASQGFMPNAGTLLILGVFTPISSNYSSNNTVAYQTTYKRNVYVYWTLYASYAQGTVLNYNNYARAYDTYIDPLYLATYPLAAAAVSVGTYLTGWAYHINVGQYLGYIYPATWTYEPPVGVTINNTTSARVTLIPTDTNNIKSIYIDRTIIVNPPTPLSCYYGHLRSASLGITDDYGIAIIGVSGVINYTNIYKFLPSDVQNTEIIYCSDAEDIDNPHGQFSAIFARKIQGASFWCKAPNSNTGVTVGTTSGQSIAVDFFSPCGNGSQTWGPPTGYYTRNTTWTIQGTYLYHIYDATKGAIDYPTEDARFNIIMYDSYLTDNTKGDKVRCRDAFGQTYYNTHYYFYNNSSGFTQAITITYMGYAFPTLYVPTGHLIEILPHERFTSNC